MEINVWLILAYIFVGFVLPCVVIYETLHFWHKHEFIQIRPHWLFGNLQPYFRDNQDFGMLLRQLHFEARVLTYAGLYMMYKPALLIRKPIAAKSLLELDHKYFNMRHLYSSHEKCPLNKTLYQQSGEPWKEQRRMLAPIFSFENICTLFTSFVVRKPLSRYLNKLTRSRLNSIGVKHVMERHLFNSLAKLVYGMRLKNRPDEEDSFRIRGLQLFRPKFWDKIMFIRDFVLPFKLQRYVHLRSHSKKLERYFIKIAKQSLEERESKEDLWNANRDYMQYLMKLRNRGVLHSEEKTYDINLNKTGGKKYLSIKNVSSQAFLAFTSLYPTALTTLTFFFYEMARNVSIQDSLYCEIDDMLQITSDFYDAVDIESLRYLDNCLNETLRLYPPVTYVKRYCSLDYRMREYNFTIKKGTPIFISILGMHHDPSLWHNPMTFDPDRFDGNKINPAFAPFGWGPRNCIGANLAKAFLKANIVYILKKYTVLEGLNMENQRIEFQRSYCEETNFLNVCFRPRSDDSSNSLDEWSDDDDYYDEDDDFDDDDNGGGNGDDSNDDDNDNGDDNGNDNNDNNNDNNNDDDNYNDDNNNDNNNDDDNSSIMTDNGSSTMSDDRRSIMTDNGSSTVSDDRSSIMTDNGSSTMSDDRSSIMTDNGSTNDSDNGSTSGSASSSRYSRYGNPH